MGTLYCLTSSLLQGVSTYVLLLSPRSFGIDCNQEVTVRQHFQGMF